MSSQDLPSHLSIEHSILIDDDPETVFDALATESGMDAWFSSRSDIGSDAGEPFQLAFDEANIVDGGVVRAYDRPDQFSFTWNADLDGGPTTVDFRIEPHEDGARVELTEEGYPLTEAGVDRFHECTIGWGEALLLCKIYIEHGITYTKSADI